MSLFLRNLFGVFLLAGSLVFQGCDGPKERIVTETDEWTFEKVTAASNADAESN